MLRRLRHALTPQRPEIPIPHYTDEELHQIGEALCRQYERLVAIRQLGIDSVEAAAQLLGIPRCG